MMFIPNGMQTIRFDAVGIEERSFLNMQAEQSRERMSGGSSRSFERAFDDAEKADNAMRESYLSDFVTQVGPNTMITVTVTTDINGRVLCSSEFSTCQLSEDRAKELQDKFDALEKERLEKERQKAAEYAEYKRILKAKERKSAIITLSITGILFILFLIELIVKHSNPIFSIIVLGVTGWFAFKSILKLFE